MTKLTKLSLLALAALTISTAIASAAAPLAAAPRPARPHLHHNTIIECRVKDDNFWIINFGDKILDSGVQIEWTSPSTHDDGTVLLPKMLAPGDEVKLAEVLSDDAFAGAPCSAAIV